MNKYPTNCSVDRRKGEAATAASVKHKCYSLTSMMYYHKMGFALTTPLALCRLLAGLVIYMEFKPNYLDLYCKFYYLFGTKYYLVILFITANIRALEGV